MTDRTPADTIAAAVTVLRDNPDALTLTVDTDDTPGWKYADRPGRKLAGLLDTLAKLAKAHPQDPGYDGLPDLRFCLHCQDEETECVAVIDGALAVAHMILGSDR